MKGTCTSEAARDEVLDAKCTPDGEDMTGTVKEGYILLAGKLLSAKLTQQPFRTSPSRKQAFSTSKTSEENPIMFGKEIDKRIFWDFDIVFQ